MSEAPARLPFAALANGSGFRADGRFAVQRAAQADAAPPKPDEFPAPDDQTTSDPLTAAFTEGFAAGMEQARAQAEADALAESEAREKLDLSFTRLDKALEEELRLRLRDTVAALCEAAIAPLAIDPEMLGRRIEQAASMLARADDERVIRLHPGDIALVSPRLAAEWEIVPDEALERGALRVEGAAGGVEDGPAIWRAAIAEALHQC